MSDSRGRKEEIIANQKRQISRLQEDLFGLVSEAEMADIQLQIEEKEDFIAQLEQEIADIDNRLED
jgi:predicted  nucleic acid-binding Zn-ribbon protein